jgi:galactitol-specific phosphotransferase system IIB component
LDKQPKKVLIISYYWPPAGGPGVQRWLKFVKYLPEFGIQPVVYIPKNPHYPLIDKQLEKEVSKEVIILQKKIWEPYTIASIFSKNKTKKLGAGIITQTKKQSLLEKTLLWIRGNIFMPDARFLWVNPSVKYLSKYIQKHNIDTIITTGPPHSLHLIGLKLKSKLPINWLADFRDPWTTIGYHKELKLSDWASKKHKDLEKKVLNLSDTIIVTSPTTKKEFQCITQKPIYVITNGFDTEEVKQVPLNEKFTLAHIGSLLSNRNPLVLWEVLQELIQENENFAKNFQLKLIGAVSKEVLETLSNYQLNNFVNNLGYLSHQEALVHQKSSQVLLLIEIDSEETKCIIPGKVFEYITSTRPIIAIGPENSDFEAIITTTNTGKFFSYKQKEVLKQTILSYFNAFLQNELQVNAINLEKYHRKNLTKELANLIKG